MAAFLSSMMAALSLVSERYLASVVNTWVEIGFATRLLEDFVGFVEWYLPFRVSLTGASLLHLISLSPWSVKTEDALFWTENSAM